MAYRDSMNVGIVVERRRLASPWQDFDWAPVAVLPGEPASAPGQLLEEGEGWARFYAGSLALELFRVEAASYRYNLASEPRQLWVALRRAEEGALPWRPLLVTAAPDEGQAALEGGEDIVEAVPMPEVIAAWIAAFVEAHGVEEVFEKRQRKKHEAEAPRRRQG